MTGKPWQVRQQRGYAAGAHTQEKHGVLTLAVSESKNEGFWGEKRGLVRCNARHGWLASSRRIE